jgi:hypothetical protein
MPRQPRKLAPDLFIFPHAVQPRRKTLGYRVYELELELKALRDVVIVLRHEVIRLGRLGKALSENFTTSDHQSTERVKDSDT